MSKEDNFEGKRVYQIGAVSKNNGILFHSTLLGVETTTEEDKRITTKVSLRDPLDVLYGVYPDHVVDHIGVRDVKTAWVNIFAIVLGILAIMMANMEMLIAIVLFRLFAMREFLNIIYSAIQTKCGKEKSLGRYHSAEHMVKNAYRSLGRVPSLEEIKKFSRFSIYCGSMRGFRCVIFALTLVVMMSISKYILWNIWVILYIITLVITYILMSSNCLKYAQVLITNKPTDLELRSAIIGLQTIVENLDKIYDGGDGKIQLITVVCFK